MIKVSVSGRNKNEVIANFKKLLSTSPPKPMRRDGLPFSCKSGKRYTTGHKGMC